MAFPLLLFLLFANRYLVGDFRSLGWSWVCPTCACRGAAIGVFTAFCDAVDPGSAVRPAQR